MKSNPHKLLLRYRLSLAFFIFGLIVSGLTAFALEIETAILKRLLPLKPPIDPTSILFPLRAFIYTIHYAIRETYARFPILGYGTDWLGFGHLVIAAFFVLPFIDPIKYRAILYVGLLACAGVVIVALTAGPMRGVPFVWRLIDCSFGFFGAIPLLYCLHLTKKIDNE
jgi:hypothetical protein